MASAQPAESAIPAPKASAERSSVPTFPGSATCQSASVAVTRAARQVVAAVDADHARRVPERRHLREQLGRDVLSRDEQVDRLDARGERRLDQILALSDEQPELVAPAPVPELADELEPLVVA